MKLVIVSTPIFAVGVGGPNARCGLPGYGGLEEIAWQTAKGLAARGHEVSLVAPEGSSCPNVQVIPIGPAGNWDERKAYGSYWQHLLQAECIIDHTWCKWAYMLKAEGRIKCPIIGVMHAPVDTMYKDLPPVEKPCIVCISEDQRLHFENLFSGRKARTCYNGIDLSFYKGVGVPRTNRYLFLGRLSSIKGADLAIRACLEVGVGLDVVGDVTITGEPDYLQQCKAMCDGKQIRLIGNVSRGETVYFYSAAHCMLHPVLRFREPFGLAPVEAMSCGCPVIAWNNGAMRETMQWRKTDLVAMHDKQGLPLAEHCLVNSMEELVAAVRWAKDNITKSDRENCVLQASQFGLARMVNRYEELCKEAVEAGGW